MTSKVQPGDVNAPPPPPDPSIYGNVFDPPPAAYPADAGSTVPPVPPPHIYPGAQQPFGFTGVQVNIPTTAMLLSASTVPTQVQCMYCNANITTVTTKVATGATYFRAAILIIALCCCGVCLVFMLWENMKDTVHSCPNCHQELARHVPKGGGGRGRRGRRGRRRRGRR